MVQLLILIVGLTALVTFWSMFKKAGSAVEQTIDLGLNVINTVNVVADESVKTYARDVQIGLANKRVEQKAEILTLKDIPSSQSLDDMLKGI